MIAWFFVKVQATPLSITLQVTQWDMGYEIGCSDFTNLPSNDGECVVLPHIYLLFIKLLLLNRDQSDQRRGLEARS